MADEPHKWDFEYDDDRLAAIVAEADAPHDWKRTVARWSALAAITFILAYIGVLQSLIECAARR